MLLQLKQVIFQNSKRNKEWTFKITSFIISTMPHTGGAKKLNKMLSFPCVIQFFYDTSSIKSLKFPFSIAFNGKGLKAGKINLMERDARGVKWVNFWHVLRVEINLSASVVFQLTAHFSSSSVTDLRAKEILHRFWVKMRV